MLSVLYLIALWIIPNLQEWTWSVHPESGFKVLTPITLDHKVMEMPTEFEVIQYHQYHAGSIADTGLALAFVIDHYILPSKEKITDSETIKEFFDSSIDQLLQELGGTLIYNDIISQAGQEVCIWKSSYHEGKGIIRGQFILAGDKYYGLQVFGLTKNKPDASMSRFLESFKIIERQSP